MPALLASLRVRNLALVEELAWEPGPGFTAITGETGAGKSIIIGALKLVLGERADKGLIRTGSEQCIVEAVFEGDAVRELRPLLDDAGVEIADDQLILKRAFAQAGTNRQFINGSPTTLAVLKNLGDELVDLHGPHDHQSLLAPDRQLALLDNFARVAETLQQYRDNYRGWQSLLAEQAALSTSEAAREQELDLLRHQVSEIRAARLSPDEEEEISARYKRASNSKRLIELAGAVATRLSEADDSILSQLAETQRLLRELEKIDPTIEPQASAHAASVMELGEVARTLMRYAEQLDLDPQQLRELEQRVTVFETLKRKYGSTLAEVIEFGERVAARMRSIEGRDEELERLSKEIGALQAEVERLGRELRKFRSKAAPEMAGKVRQNLRDLGFRQSEFEAQLTELEAPNPSGFDTVELMFSPNPGEPLKPLRAIASSGEISRLMLAIKSALAEQDAIPLLVFDEIDANVGGEIANAVGTKMRQLAAAHQVLCITHLPQVAAAASSHFVVTKEFAQGRTFSHLRELTGKARQEEIARMLGGQSDSALKHAAALLKQDNRSK